MSAARRIQNAAKISKLQWQFKWFKGRTISEIEWLIPWSDPFFIGPQCRSYPEFLAVRRLCARYTRFLGQSVNDWKTQKRKYTAPGCMVVFWSYPSGCWVKDCCLIGRIRSAVKRSWVDQFGESKYKLELMTSGMKTSIWVKKLVP